MKKNKWMAIMLAIVAAFNAWAWRDLETGTFLTRDPIGYEDGPNIYCYVRSNPVMNFDPLGLEIKAVTPVYSGHPHFSDMRYMAGAGSIAPVYLKVAAGNLGAKARVNSGKETVLMNTGSFGGRSVNPVRVPSGSVGRFKFEYKIDRTGQDYRTARDYPYADNPSAVAKSYNYRFGQWIIPSRSGLYYREKGAEKWLLHPDTKNSEKLSSSAWMVADGPNTQSELSTDPSGVDVTSWAGDMPCWQPSDVSENMEYMMSATWLYRAEDKDNAVEGAHRVTFSFSGNGELLESSSTEIVAPSEVGKNEGHTADLWED